MAQADEIARDIVVALLANSRLNINTPEQGQQVGEVIGKVYTAVLGAVREAQTQPTTRKVSGV